MMMRVVGVERAPAAILALHADDPFGGAVDRLPVALAVEAVEREARGGGIVDIGVMRVFILKGPTAGAQPRAPHRPIADDIEHLSFLEPIESAAKPWRRRLADIHQGMA